jgi:hypothetical protein
MATVIPIALRVHNQGHSEYPAIPIPDEGVNVEMKLNSVRHNNPNQRVKAGFHVSYDGGATWKAGASLSRTGKVWHDDEGNVINDFRIATTILPGTNRLVKMFIEINQGALQIDNGSFTIS